MDDKQIEALLCKEIKCKTLLVLPTEIEQKINEHLQDGWELVNKVAIGEKVKITFRKIK